MNVNIKERYSLFLIYLNIVINLRPVSMVWLVIFISGDFNDSRERINNCSSFVLRTLKRHLIIRIEINKVIDIELI